MKRLLEPADLLLGRHTFQIWENYWPTHATAWPGINDVTKYVLSTTVKQSEWNACVFLNRLDDIQMLKASTGSNIHVWGSSKLVQLLLKNDLIDECWLMIHPVILGQGKKLFDDGLIPAAFVVEETIVTSSGVIIVNYRRAGEVKTGTAGV